MVVMEVKWKNNNLVMPVFFAAQRGVGTDFIVARIA